MPKLSAWKNILALSLILVVVAASAAILVNTDAHALLFDPYVDDPPDDDGSGGGCSYCDSSACGCSSPPVGCTLVFSCSCSSVDCRRTCDFTC